MKITRFLVLIALALATTANAQNPVGACPFSASSLVASYKEMITVSSTALPFTAATWNPTNGTPKAVCATVVVNSNSISWWGSGQTPTASDGIITASGGSFSVGEKNMASFRMIRVSSDAAVAVQYFTLAP